MSLVPGTGLEPATTSLGMKYPRYSLLHEGENIERRVFVLYHLSYPGVSPARRARLHEAARDATGTADVW